MTREQLHALKEQIFERRDEPEMLKVMAVADELYSMCSYYGLFEDGDTQTLIDDKLRVVTPLGTLIAYRSCDPEYPGIYIDLRRPTSDADVSVALIEYTETEPGNPKNEPLLITRVWGNAQDHDYTDRVIHEEIEKFFELIEV